MKTPDSICLIDTGDEITWCDSVPSSDIDERDVVWYGKQTEIDRLRCVLGNIQCNDMRSHFNRVDAMTLSNWAREALKPEGK